MSTASKARWLVNKIEDELMEVEHLYRILKTNVVPLADSEKAAHKVRAMGLIKRAMDSLEEAQGFLNEIGKD